MDGAGNSYVVPHMCVCLDLDGYHSLPVGECGHRKHRAKNSNAFLDLL